MSNWKVITLDDVYKVLSTTIAQKADEGDDGQTFEQNNLEDAETTRQKEIVLMVAEEFRGAIRNGGRNALSVLAAAVPPDCVRHVLNMAAYQLINSTPNLGMIIITEKGVSSPFQIFYTEAVKHLELLRQGLIVEPPSDPAGRDYLTAVSASNLALSSFRWGDSFAEDFEYASGKRDGIDIYPPRMTTN